MKTGANVWWEDNNGHLQSNRISSSRIFGSRTPESEAFYLVPDSYEHVVIYDHENMSHEEIRVLLREKKKKA